MKLREMNIEIRRIQDSIGQLENVIRGTNCFQGTDTVAKVREEIRRVCDRSSNQYSR